MKKLASSLLILATVMSLCACGGTGRTKDEKTVTMNVRAHYSGWGVAGNFLGSGVIEYEVTDLKEGDVILEGFGGEFHIADEKYDDEYYSFKIGSIRDDAVTVFAGNGDYSLGFDRGENGFDFVYGDEKYFNSSYYMADGINYTFDISFSKGGES